MKAYKDPATKKLVPTEFYSLEDYPYVKEILNSRAQYNWVMKAAQVGLSEAAMTIALFEVDYHQRDVIYYFPPRSWRTSSQKRDSTTPLNSHPTLIGW